MYYKKWQFCITAKSLHNYRFATKTIVFVLSLCKTVVFAFIASKMRPSCIIIAVLLFRWQVRKTSWLLQLRFHENAMQYVKRQSWHSLQSKC